MSRTSGELDPRTRTMATQVDFDNSNGTFISGAFVAVSLLIPAKSFLEGTGKRLGPGAEEALRDRLGGQMRLLQSELEKLVAYTQGPVIRREDVEAVVAGSAVAAGAAVPRPCRP